jgi:hypothetical protein
MEFLLLLEVWAVSDLTGVRGLPVVLIRHTEVAAAAAWDLLARRETVGRESVALASLTLDRPTQVAEVVVRIHRRALRVDQVLAALVAMGRQPVLSDLHLLAQAAAAVERVAVVAPAAAVMVLPA